MPHRTASHTNRGRAEAFGAVAASYDRHRPTYPEALVDDLVGLGPRSVVDVGCGTGKAAVLLDDRGLDVLGVEVDPKMAEVARSHGIAVEVASFEDWDAAGRSFDLLVSGQAWHWVHPRRGADKAAEVVRPGGAVALFWNHDELAAGTQRRLDEVYEQRAPELMTAPDEHASARRLHLEPFENHPAYASVETRSYHWHRHYTAHEWVGMCLTYSDHLLLPPPRRDALAAQLTETINSLGGIAADYETFLVLAHRAS